MDKTAETQGFYNLDPGWFRCQPGDFPVCRTEIDMEKIRQVLGITIQNMKRQRKNSQIILTFVLAFVLCLMLTEKAVSFADNYHTSMQAVETFVWVFGDADSIMISSLLLALLFLDVPLIEEFTPYYLFRMNKKIWIAGQILYVLIVTLIYILFLLAVTCVICSPVSFIGNMWSETGALLGYSGVGEEIALPASVKVMEMSLPYQCAGTVCLLILLYSVFLAAQMMAWRVSGKKVFSVVSVFLINLYGLMLNPEIFTKLFHLSKGQEYKANVLAGWLSPLNHATYYMHNFGYDYLPKIWMSCLIFLILIAVCIVIIVKKMKKYEFQFQRQMDE